jgi:hypothetical protein
MCNHLATRRGIFRRTLCTLLLALMLPQAGAQVSPLGGQIPQVPAFLPIVTDVPMTQRLPIDGEWVISTIHKRIRIEGGRAYALDPWVHLFVLKIEPLMVVLKDMQRTSPGQYTGQDLPLLGKFTASIAPDGSLSVSVAGAMGPARYSLIPLRLDDQQSFAQERSGQYVPPPPSQTPQQPYPQPAPPAQVPQPIAQPAPAPGAPPGQDLSKCKKLDIDPASGRLVCRD